jgi:hypothetical protein
VRHKKVEKNSCLKTGTKSVEKLRPQVRHKKVEKTDTSREAQKVKKNS